jgi:regulatory protein
VQPHQPSQPRSPKKRNDEPTAAARALRLLARRDYTRQELERKLEPHVDDPAALQALLDAFTARGWLSESRAVDQLVHAKRGRFGTARIRQALIERGVSEEGMASALESLKATELESARAVWSRKFKRPPTTPAERAKHVRFLQYRGFSVDIAMRVIGGRDTGEND